MNTEYSIPLAIVFAGVILAGAVYMTVRQGFTPALQASPAQVRPITPDDHLLGNPLAKVQIIEYADFDCTHCKTFHQTLRRIIGVYGASGNVAWITRHFPITELHPNAKKHAEAAECVARTTNNETYFVFTDLLYARQPADPLKYAEYAHAVGANPETVANCLRNADTNGISERVDADRKNALAMGAEGTPYALILVPNEPPIVIENDIPFDALKEVIDRALAL
jgi:protein-disulfide isomerase